MNWQFHRALYAPCNRPKLIAMIEANYGHVGRFIRVQVSLATGKEKPQREGYALLAEALRKTGTVAIATYADLGRDHVACVTQDMGMLLMHVLCFAEDVRDDSEVRNLLDGIKLEPSSVVSLILRVLAVKKLKLWPLLILDESLAAVSDDYIDLTGQFIRALTEKLGIDLILVTHKPAFLDHAHAAFRCTEEVESDGVSTYVVVKKAS